MTLRDLSPDIVQIVGCTKNNSELVIAGRRINGKSKEDALTLSAVPDDGTVIRLKFAQNGYFTLIEQLEPHRSNLAVYKLGSNQLEKTLSSGPCTIGGNFMITYRTNCGLESKNVKVTITVKPNHEKDEAEISYSISK